MVRVPTTDSDAGWLNRDGSGTRAKEKSVGDGVAGSESMRDVAPKRRPGYPVANAG
jgi:hypothetical protein